MINIGLVMFVISSILVWIAAASATFGATSRFVLLYPVEGRLDRAAEILVGAICLLSWPVVAVLLVIVLLVRLVAIAARVFSSAGREVWEWVDTIIDEWEWAVE